MTNPLKQCIALFPLRLEIRKISGRPLVAHYPADSKFAGKNISVSSLSFSDQYWIRWYPDEIAINVPAKRITSIEKKAFKTLLDMYNLQKNTILSIDQKYQEQLKSIDRTSSLEDCLFIYNQIFPGKLTDKQAQLCSAYNEEALNDILNSYKNFSETTSYNIVIGRRLGWGIYDLKNPVLSIAWDKFVNEVGLTRARYIASCYSDQSFSRPLFNLDNADDFNESLTAENDPIEDVIEKGIPVAFIPQSVQIFIASPVHDQTTNLIAEPLGKPIEIVNSSKLLVGITENEKLNWQTNFEVAVKEGMGAKIDKEELVKKIDNAEWILVIGFNADNPLNQQLEQVLANLRSRGEFAIVPQDTPTNNTQLNDTTHKKLPDDIADYINQSKNKVSHNNYAEVLLKDYLSNNFIYKNEHSLTDAQLLSYILNLNPQLFDDIPDSGMVEQTEAEAMGLFIWKITTAGMKKYLIHDLESKDKEKFEEKWQVLEKIFARYVRARGPLPTLKIGKNPYAVLPIIRQGDLFEDAHADNLTNKVLGLIAGLSHLITKSKMKPMLENIPKLQDNNNKYDSLLEILQLNSSSKSLRARRYRFLSDPDQQVLSSIDNFDERSFFEPGIISGHLTLDESTDLGYLKALAYGSVTQIDTDHPPQIKYEKDSKIYILKSPQEIRMDEMATDKNEDNTKKTIYSVLHRLLSIYLYEKDEKLFSDKKFDWPKKISDRQAELKEIAAYLLNINPEKLAILMMEIFDLLCFRVDAWQTALATLKLYECLNSQGYRHHGIGVYGWLENPGKISAVSHLGEYLQAPSLGQAATAAILRNSAIHSGSENPTSSFHINLSSDRVKKALWYLSALRQGYSTGEILGYRLEKIIHAEASKMGAVLKDKDIYALRNIFRLPKQLSEDLADDEQPFMTSLINGKEFIDNFNKVDDYEEIKNNSDKRTKLSLIRDDLNKIIDSVADTAVAELMHQFMQGNSIATTAWMDFLDGEVDPPPNQFMHAARTGKFQNSRVLLVLSGPAQETIENVEADQAFCLLKMINPILDQFCHSLMPTWSEDNLALQVSIEGTNFSQLLNDIKVANLAVSPLEFVLLEYEEVLFRIKCYLLKNSLLTNDATLNNIVIKFNEDSDSYQYLKRAERIKHLINSNRKENELLAMDPNRIAESALNDNLFSNKNVTIHWEKMYDDINHRLTCVKNRFDFLKDELDYLLLENDEQEIYSGRELITLLQQFNIVQAFTSLPLSYSSNKEFIEQIIKELKTRENRFSKITAITKDKEGILRICEKIGIILGRPNLPILIPYFPVDDTWKMDFKNNMNPNSENFPLAKYKAVNSKINNFCDVIDQSNYTPHYYEKMDSDISMDNSTPIENLISKIPTARELYYTNEIDQKAGLSVLLIDQWVEYIPNQNENTGIAMRYDSPKSQAPNAILLSVPAKEGCDLLLRYSVPDAKNLSELPIQSDAAYIFVKKSSTNSLNRNKDKLFYINKMTDESKEIKFKPNAPAEKLVQFENIVNANANAMRLDEKQLNTITSITGHTHQDTPWNEKKIAQTVADTLTLMKLRMIGSEQIINDGHLGKFFPLTYTFFEQYSIASDALNLKKDIKFAWTNNTASFVIQQESTRGE